MVRLLIADSAPTTLSAQHRFGGLPVVPNGTVFNWPTCKQCAGTLQYLGHLHVRQRDELVLLFMCQNDPGLCDVWEADAGCNAAIVVASHDLCEVAAPIEGESVRDTTYGAIETELSVESYDAARTMWCEKTGKNPRNILGQILGAPDWIQGDEVPNCNCCGLQMSFLAQLEEGPAWETAMNFGGGCAYVFCCLCGEHSAKFMWQC